MHQDYDVDSIDFAVGERQNVNMLRGILNFLGQIEQTK
jgi:hypothetical protein